MNKVTLFTDENGYLSMRRFLAFILVLTSIGALIVCIILNRSWQITLVSCGVPLVGAIVLLFFTTWSDIGSVVGKIKGSN